jgi:hypothetical protein
VSAAGATEADADQSKHKPPPGPCTRRFQPAFKVSHRVVRDDCRRAAVIRSDKQAQHTALREAEESDTLRVHAGVSTHPIDGAHGIRRILPREEALAPAITLAALIIGGNREIACFSQIVQNAPHVRRTVSSLGMDDYRRQRHRGRRPHPL